MVDGEEAAGRTPVEVARQGPEQRRHGALAAAEAAVPGAAPANVPGTGPAKAASWDSGRAAGEDVRFGEPGGPLLSGYVARPNFSAASGAGRHGVVLSHGFPGAGHTANSPSYGYPQLATRLAAETGAAVLTFDFRGTGDSQGDVSLAGWRADLHAATTFLSAVPGIEKIWLVGFGAGGALSVCVAGEDPSLAGVAIFSSPAELAEHAGEPRRFAAQARTGVPAHGYPGGTDRPRSAQLRPTRLVGQIPPRPLLIVHGTNDEVVPLTDARELADAANESAELRILAGASHLLMHDPRAIALLLGWFDRHLGAVA